MTDVAPCDVLGVGAGGGMHLLEQVAGVAIEALDGARGQGVLEPQTEVVQARDR